MLYFDGAVGVAIFCLWVFCLADVIVTDDSLCRHLPKMFWLLVVLLVPLVGSILWLAIGRPRVRSAPSRPSRFPEYDRPGRHVAVNPDDDAEFLRQCRERAEQQRRRAKEQGL
ncbi:PLDc N-terminal domain-containing protein [Kutzneria sp. CA-103260]|uniref:PLDc N-terminal domain-containing protein n=1 Tax=Kutzneria sp. CA-103260 TaxID=2802641 RepID=UPI001BAC159D|nr:PLDc N-terminal domain-containing protein [Kutzneria sp. CA-103260]QUQ70155.1 membrane protein [Kutzneria sp. CA-103260]